MKKLWRRIRQNIIWIFNMTREDIEKMRAVAPEMVEKLERGETIETPKYITLFHQFQQLSEEDQIRLVNMIADYLEK